MSSVLKIELRNGSSQAVAQQFPKLPSNWVAISNHWAKPDSLQRDQFDVIEFD